MQFFYNDMQVEIIRQKRKTLSIVITPEGRVEARAPKNLPNEIILSFVEEKREWIEKKLKEREMFSAPRKNYVGGEELMILGLNYTLTFYDGQKIGLSGDKLLFPEKYESEVKTRLSGWYKSRAKIVLKSILDEESKRLGVSYGKFRVSTARTRWGSCSGKNDIALNYRLLSAPEYVIRAVCLHELCHVIHKNHGTDYKRLLANVSPQDKQANAWLKAHPIFVLGE